MTTCADCALISGSPARVKSGWMFLRPLRLLGFFKGDRISAHTCSGVAATADVASREPPKLNDSFPSSRWYSNPRSSRASTINVNIHAEYIWSRFFHAGRFKNSASSFLRMLFLSLDFGKEDSVRSRI